MLCNLLHWLIRLGLVVRLLSVPSACLLLHNRIGLLRLLLGLLLLLLLNGLLLLMLMGDFSISTLLRVLRIDFSELVNEFLVLVLYLLSELSSDVNQVVRVDHCTSIHLAVSVDIRSLQELLVEADEHLLLRLANDSSTESERDIHSLS